MLIPKSLMLLIVTCDYLLKNSPNFLLLYLHVASQADLTLRDA